MSDSNPKVFLYGSTIPPGRLTRSPGINYRYISDNISLPDKDAAAVLMSLDFLDELDRRDMREGFLNKIIEEIPDTVLLVYGPHIAAGGGFLPIGMHYIKEIKLTDGNLVRLIDRPKDSNLKELLYNINS